MPESERQSLLVSCWVLKQICPLEGSMRELGKRAHWLAASKHMTVLLQCACRETTQRISSGVGKPQQPLNAQCIAATAASLASHMHALL